MILILRTLTIVGSLGLAGVCSAAPVVVPQAVRSAEAERIAVMHRVAPSVVAIFAAGGQGGGSGVLIDNAGYTVTNFHVVQGLGGFMKCGLNDGKIYDAVLVGIDPTGDVALVKLLGRDDFPHAQVGNSDQLRVGDCVFAMGNPFLLATDFQPTVTYGIVSGVHRYQFPAGTFLEYTDCIQVDASINPGNSGGPLFTCRGELIGINGRISVQKRGRVNVGAGYAISINQVMHFLDHLKSGRIVDHATLGATVTGTSDGSVVVTDILENSEAYRRGLRRDDELVSFAGRPVRSVNQFKNILGIYPQGWAIPLSYRRDGQRHDIRVRLMGLHRRSELTGETLPGPDAPEKKPQQPDEDQPEREPHPQPGGHAAPKQEIPERYADLFEERTGYANYRFNALAQERLLKGLEDWGDYSMRPPAWALTGTLNSQVPVQIRLQPDALAAKIGDSFAAQDLGAEYADVPRGSGGLLAALEQLKHLLADREDYFTELYYVGSEPLGDDAQRVDVLVTTRSTVTTRWYFRKTGGELIGFDTAIDEHMDPCEVRFEELASQGDVKFPKSLSVRQGDQPYGTLTVDSLTFFAPPAAGGKQP